MSVCIVTCDRDRAQFLVQCKSINLYLNPCQLAVIINEADAKSWMSWFDLHCRPLLAKHNLTVYTRQDFSLDINQCDGWISQQILKLAYAYRTTGRYVILDSKNWFVKTCNWDDFPVWPRRFNPIENADRLCNSINSNAGKPTAGSGSAIISSMTRS